MTAQIIPFPTPKPDAERLALLGDIIGRAIPMPERDMELDMLLTIAGKLLDNFNDYVMPDCSGLIESMDDWLGKLDRWEAKTAG